jgi:hypothetical protein
VRGKALVRRSPRVARVGVSGWRTQSAVPATQEGNERSADGRKAQTRTRTIRRSIGPRVRARTLRRIDSPSWRRATTPSRVKLVQRPMRAFEIRVGGVVKPEARDVSRLDARVFAPRDWRSAASRIGSEMLRVKVKTLSAAFPSVSAITARVARAIAGSGWRAGSGRSRLRLDPRGRSRRLLGGPWRRWPRISPRVGRRSGCDRIRHGRVPG